MTHLSGGAISGIGFGTALFVFVAVSLALWWRRVYRDHYSKDPNAWGGSWGIQAQLELQAKFDRQREEEWKAKQAVEQAIWEDIESRRTGGDCSDGVAEGKVEVVEGGVAAHDGVAGPEEVKSPIKP